ncbi:hypothetical protein [Aquipuribacter hungaricus]|uniref:DUF916 domain-containing protein n=1 Tax=Aquipuribacter hungaricus TaxID=545624 RepID=A0ABV7WIR0_9MICO
MLTALLLGGLVAAPASAAPAPEPSAAATPPPVRWAVTPADEDGPDGRTAAEHTLDPGERVEDRFAVRNLGPEEVTFRLAAADGFTTRTGRFDILPSDQESVAAGTWVELPPEVTVAPGGTEVVGFAVAVPEDAEPGDHTAGITASVLSVQSAEDGTSVGVESRVGFRLLTRVTGDITPSAGVRAVSGSYDLSWNAFRPGGMTVTFDVVDDGNTRLLAEGSVSAGGGDVAFPGPGEQQELLPGDTRSLRAEVDGVWPTLLVPVDVTLAPTVVTVDGEAPTLEPVVQRTWVWAVPWPQLALLLGLLLVVAALAQGRRRSRRRLAALLEDAREQGRQQAGTSAP